MIGEPSQVKDIYFFEAAVDALSYWSFNKDTIRDTMLVDLEGVKVEKFYQFSTVRSKSWSSITRP
jgi:hypothetical protein